MARTNISQKAQTATHEGAKATLTDPAAELRRAAMTCFLWENKFYEGSDSIASRMAALCQKLSPKVIAEIAIECRQKMNLRHVGLFLLVQMVQRKSGSLLADTILKVVQRPDEMGELLSIYWKGGRKPLPYQFKCGLREVFERFSPNALARYDGDNPVKLRDVMFLVHPKPDSDEKAKAYKKLAARELRASGSWETRLAAGEDKKTVFTELLKSRSIGYMALLRNLRNMEQAGIDEELIADRLKDTEAQGFSQVLPYRFLAALKAVSGYQLKGAIEGAFLARCREMPKLTGSTAVIVDVSGSMGSQMSGRSQMTLLDAASALASIFVESCEQSTVYTFSQDVVEVGGRGIGLMEAIDASQPHGGTYLGSALGALQQAGKLAVDRIVVLTDEQLHDELPNSAVAHAYTVNMAGYQPSLNYAQGWHRLEGFSERLVDYVALTEATG